MSSVGNQALLPGQNLWFHKPFLAVRRSIGSRALLIAVVARRQGGFEQRQFLHKPGGGQGHLVKLLLERFIVALEHMDPLTQGVYLVEQLLIDDALLRLQMLDRPACSYIVPESTEATQKSTDPGHSGGGGSRAKRARRGRFPPPLIRPRGAAMICCTCESPACQYASTSSGASTSAW